MGEFEKEIKKEAMKILKNLDFEAVQVNKDKEGASILLKDKNSNFKCWFDLLEYMGDYSGDWNEYIFNLNNSKDLLKKYIQESPEAYEMAFEIALEALEMEL